MQLDHIAAWQHFYTAFRGSPEWNSLTAKEKNRLILADKDSRGERDKIAGRKMTLGFIRVERILKKYAPGRYAVVRVLAFEVIE